MAIAVPDGERMTIPARLIKTGDFIKRHRCTGRRYRMERWLQVETVAKEIDPVARFKSKYVVRFRNPGKFTGWIEYLPGSAVIVIRPITQREECTS